MPNRDVPVASRDLGRYLTRRLGVAEALRSGMATYTAPGRTPIRLAGGSHVSANIMRLVARENGLGSLSQAVAAVRKGG